MRKRARSRTPVPSPDRRRVRRAVVATTTLALLAAALLAGRVGARARADDAATATESVEAIEAEWAKVLHPEAADVHRFMLRFHVAKGGEARARLLAHRMLGEFDPGNRAAHELLGHKEFTEEVPEEISYRRYPFVRIVEEANEQRWFDDEERWAGALEALAKCRAHAKRLEAEPAYAALDVARRGIDQDANLRAYNYDAIFASPFLLCYTTRERIDEAAMWRMSKAERAKAWAELDARRVGYKRVLAEKARIYTQVYAEFLRRYGEACALKPLMDPFGGRPDYPAGKRSFREGCPMIVWIFADRAAWDQDHEIRRDPIPSSVAGYLRPNAGHVVAYDRAPTDADDDLHLHARLATAQVMHYFRRQLNEWAHAYDSDDAIWSGFMDWFGSVTMARDRTLTFTGVHRPLLGRLRQWRELRAQTSKPLPRHALRVLLGIASRSEAMAAGAEALGVPPSQGLELFRIESWAFMLFLTEGLDAKYRARVPELVRDLLGRPTRGEDDKKDARATRIGKLLGLATLDDWTRIDQEFGAFYEALAMRDPASIGPLPPALSDWPGYVAPDLEAPTGPPSGR